MTRLLLWTHTCVLIVTAHLLLSTATDTQTDKQTDARRKPTRQQQHRKPTSTADINPLPWNTPPSSVPPPPPPPQWEPWGTGTKNDGVGGGGRTTRRISHSRKLRRNEAVTVEKAPFTAVVTASPTSTSPSPSSPSSSPSPPSSPPSSSSPSLPPALRSVEIRRVAPSGIQDIRKHSEVPPNAPEHHHHPHHHQKSVTARTEFPLRQKTSHEPTPPLPTPPPPSHPPGVGLGKDVALPCRDACDTSRCPQVEAEACRGMVVKDNCNCCPVCVATPRTNHSKSDYYGHPQQKNPSNACDGMVCEKNKVCILNIQGIPMCRCRNIYICRSAERKPICTVNGTFKNKCFLQVEECTTGKRIRVVHRGSCARSPVRQAKPYL